MKKVVSLPPRTHVDWMFLPEVWGRLCAEYDVWQNPEPRHLAPEAAAERIRECDAVITGWGARPFSPELLAAAPNLRIVVHIAGSPRGLFADQTIHDTVISRGLTIYSGADNFARNVAEATIGLMILATRQWPIHQSAFKARQQTGTAPPPLPANNAQYLTGARVGLVSASKVARQVVPFLRAFDCTILVHDPYLTVEAARDLGVKLATLDELFSTCDIVSLHAPDLPATRGMIGANLLAKLRDGAAFINTSRGTVLDQDALLRECQTGRIFAALDVTEPEPLPGDSPFWDLPNVLLLPHVAGQGRAGYTGIGHGALQALNDVFAGRPVTGAVPLDRWETVA